MFKWIKSSLYTKLVSVFLLVTFLPMIIIWSVYIFKAKDQIIEENLRQIAVLSKQINNSLNEKIKQIKLDLNLMAQYEIFDDIIASDIDKRIQNHLSNKQDHMLFLGDFYVLNMDGNVIATTNLEALNSTYDKLPLSAFKPLSISKFSKNKVITLTEPIFSSFNKSEQLGYIVLEYFGSNLINFTSFNEYESTFFYNPKSGDAYGEKISNTKLYDINNEYGFFFTDDLIFSYQILEGNEFSGFYFIQALKKSKVMSFYEEFSQTILFAMLFGLILVVLIGAKLANILTTPINDLSKLAKQIEEHNDYSIRAKVKGKDEIAILGNTINNLLETVQLMIEKTQKESTERLRTLTQLIYIFNAITQENNEQDVFESACQRVGNFLNESVHIDSKKNTEQFQEPISYIDVTNNEKVSCGYMSYVDKDRTLLEKQFLESIATMVGLQIERLHLVKEANSASEAKSSFISNMSHELRTPLNAILGFSQILDKKVQNDKEKKMVQNILTAGTHLLNLINDILDIAKIEAGKIDLKIEEIKVEELLNDVKIITSKLAASKGLSYKVELEDSFSIYTDIKLLKQILVNQLSNAIKFTEKGSVTIHARADKSNVYFNIIDTGIGISEDNLNKLFKEFVQIHNQLQDKHKGTGLGLVLSKNLAHELGGDLTLSSIEGEGTTAHLVIAKKLIEKND